jgi:hypothetical protein
MPRQARGPTMTAAAKATPAAGHIATVLNNAKVAMATAR